MYFVDRQKIEQQLTYLEKSISTYSETVNWDDPIARLALERSAQIMLDCVLDVGNSMIDGFIMRDPGSYEDIVDILLDEKVIGKEMEESLKALLPLRKMIVQNYLEIDHGMIHDLLSENLGALREFPKAVRVYLEHQLGPVSAFRN